MNDTHVILVNEHDEWLGSMEKLEAHQKGLLHRAFSVFILNDKNEMLLQRRALNKYHSGGLWSNACCSHPLVGESTIKGARRRLMEEMGFDCIIEPIFNFRYKADVGHGLIENEYDHIFHGFYNGSININPSEVSDYKFVPLDELPNLVNTQPNNFTKWFHLALPKYIKEIESYCS